MAKPAEQPKPDAGKADWDDDEGANWRHPPVAPKDANPLDSLGQAVTESITGSEPDKSRAPKT